MKKGDEVSGGKYILVPTIAELVQHAGGRTVIASAKTVGLLLDRQADVGTAKNCVTLFAGKSLPAGIDPFHYCNAWSLSVWLTCNRTPGQQKR